MYDHLTDEQLQRLEGETREAVFDRLRELYRIQQQLTGVITQLSQLYVMYPERATENASAGPSNRPSNQTNL